jgi:hypothetical protein
MGSKFLYMKQEAKESRLGVQNVDINGGLVISLKTVRGKSSHWELVLGTIARPVMKCDRL